MFKILRTTKDDAVFCPRCGKYLEFTNSIAPVICDECSCLLPDADDMTLPRGEHTRIAYHLDTELYD